jgi:hypothetical protein
MGTGLSVPVFVSVRYRTSAACFGALVLAACHSLTPAEKAAQDARDVAVVEAIQHRHPPLQRIHPQPIDVGVRRLFNLTDAGCDFRSGQRGGGPVLVAGRAKAALLIDGKPVIYAADSGSPALPFGTHEKYVGRSNWAQLVRKPGEGAPGQLPMSLTIRDRFARVAYFARGTLTCHG